MSSLLVAAGVRGVDAIDPGPDGVGDPLVQAFVRASRTTQPAFHGRSPGDTQARSVYRNSARPGDPPRLASIGVRSGIALRGRRSSVGTAR